MLSVGIHRRSQFIKPKTPPKVEINVVMPHGKFASNHQSEASSEWSFNSSDVENDMQTLGSILKNEGLSPTLSAKAKLKLQVESPMLSERGSKLSQQIAKSPTVVKRIKQLLKKDDKVMFEGTWKNLNARKEH